MQSNSEQRFISHGNVRVEQDAGELLEDYARFIGISAEEVLNIVLIRMMANDTDFQSWSSLRGVQLQSGPIPLRLPVNAEDKEAA